MWIWPLLSSSRTWPDEPGQFATARKHDIHTGVDLYTEPMTDVVAVELGIVVNVEPFTGDHAGSPWWNRTWATLVEGPSGVVAYGEILPAPGLRIGDVVDPGMRLGHVLTVLPKDKGRPRTMLHLELYARGTRKTVWWKLGESRPAELLDPTSLLKEAFLSSGR